LLLLVFVRVVVAEHVVHYGCTAADRGDDYVPVDGLGDMGGLVAYRVADLLDRDAVAAHDRDCGVAAFMGVPVADARLPSHLGEAPVEGIGRVSVAVLLAEHEVVGAPVFVGFVAFLALSGLMWL
jgi:hypothetical protein